MTREQRQKLSAATDIAVRNNDINALVDIYSIIRQDLKEQPNTLGSEWFLSSIDVLQWQAIQKKLKKNK
jgi:hypothetical protein